MMLLMSEIIHFPLVVVVICAPGGSSCWTSKIKDILGHISFICVLLLCYSRTIRREELRNLSDLLFCNMEEIDQWCILKFLKTFQPML
mmetsp:Transcript_44846/g.67497  ORF Transcript_44846/g.67497 Transcript_44846/m.67497 type:complete len:88 (-) Transcript_44846:1340-1603(-)